MSSFRSEKELGAILGLALVVLVPLIIGLVAMAKFARVSDPVVLDHAQLARQLEAGHGFTTTVLRPLSLAVVAKPLPHPDLVNAPAHPLALTAFYRVLGDTDRAVSAMGLAMWLVTTWLTFGLFWRWWSLRTAVLATVFYLSSSAALVAAVGGLPSSLLAVLVLLAFWAVLPAGDVDHSSRQDLPAWQLAIGGGVTAGAVLTEYAMVGFALVLGVFVVNTAAHRKRALGWYGGVLLMLVAPWLVRNWLGSGVGPLGLYVYSAVAGTREFAGDTVWQSMTMTNHPLVYLALHPAELVRKISKGLAQYRSFMIAAANPVVVVLFIVAVARAPGTSHRGRLARLSLVTMTLVTLWTCVFELRTDWLLAWMPLLAGVAAAQTAVLLKQQVGSWQLPFRAWWQKSPQPIRVPKTLLRVVVVTGLVLLVTLPAASHLSRYRFIDRPHDRFAQLDKLLPETGILLSDQPAEMAWRLKRPVLWLCYEEADLAPLLSMAGELTAIHVSPAVQALPRQKRGDWWPWLSSPRGIYDGLGPRPNNPVPGVLRTALHTDPAAAPAESQPLKQLAALKTNPNSAEARIHLGREYLAAGRLREAHAEFGEAHRLDKYSVESVVGQWQTMAELNQPAETLRAAQAVGQLSPRSPEERLVLEEAAAHLDRSLRRDPNNVWLLLQAILGSSKLGQWQQVRGYYQQLSRVLPSMFPSALMSATLYLQQGDLDNASDTCKRQIAEQPWFPAGYQLAGRIHLARGDHEEALANFRKMVDLRPHWVQGFLELAGVCQQLQRHDEAIQNLQAAAKLAPNPRPIQLQLAQAHVDQEQPDEAMTIYREILDEDPRHVVALNNLAELLLRQGNAEEALVLALRAVELRPRHPRVRDTAGWAAFQAGNQDEALAHLQEALRLAPRQAITHYHLGKVSLARDQRKEAARFLREALEGGLEGAQKEDAEKLLASNQTGD